MKILFIIFVVLILFIVFVRYLESTSVFYPTRQILVTPDQFGLPFEDVNFRTEDRILLNGWFIEATAAKATLLFFHGNAGNISDRLEKIAFFHQLGLNVFIIDYRGYGKSEGKPSEEGIYKDARGAFDYLVNQRKLDPSSIIAYGASLGGSVAVDLATQRQLGCLIIDSSFSSAADIAKRIYPFIPAFLLSIKLDSMTKINKITIPKLFIHSTEDEIVSIELGKKLYDAAAGPKKFVEILGGHNDGFVVSQDRIYKSIRDFLKDKELL